MFYQRNFNTMADLYLRHSPCNGYKVHVGSACIQPTLCQSNKASSRAQSVNFIRPQVCSKCEPEAITHQIIYLLLKKICTNTSHLQQVLLDLMQPSKRPPLSSRKTSCSSVSRFTKVKGRFRLTSQYAIFRYSKCRLSGVHFAMLRRVLCQCLLSMCLSGFSYHAQGHVCCALFGDGWPY